MAKELKKCPSRRSDLRILPPLHPPSSKKISPPYSPDSVCPVNRIIMLGLEGSGKSTILKQLNLGEIERTYPLSSFYVDNIEQDSNLFHSFSLSPKSEVYLSFFIV